jgi:hypothetical protein
MHNLTLAERPAGARNPLSLIGHRRVLEQLLIHGPLSFEDLRAKSKLRIDQFGLILGELAEPSGKQNRSRPIEWWWVSGTRYYKIKSSTLAKAA